MGNEARFFTVSWDVHVRCALQNKEQFMGVKEKEKTAIGKGYTQAERSDTHLGLPVSL